MQAARRKHRNPYYKYRKGYNTSKYYKGKSVGKTAPSKPREVKQISFSVYTDANRLLTSFACYGRLFQAQPLANLTLLGSDVRGDQYSLVPTVSQISQGPSQTQRVGNSIYLMELRLNVSALSSVSNHVNNQVPGSIFSVYVILDTKPNGSAYIESSELFDEVNLPANYVPDPTSTVMLHQNSDRFKILAHEDMSLREPYAVTDPTNNTITNVCLSNYVFSTRIFPKLVVKYGAASQPPLMSDVLTNNIYVLCIPEGNTATNNGIQVDVGVAVTYYDL